MTERKQQLLRKLEQYAKDYADDPAMWEVQLKYLRLWRRYGPEWLRFLPLVPLLFDIFVPMEVLRLLREAGDAGVHEDILESLTGGGCPNDVLVLEDMGWVVGHTEHDDRYYLRYGGKHDEDDRAWRRAVTDGTKPDYESVCRIMLRHYCDLELPMGGNGDGEFRLLLFAAHAGITDEEFMAVGPPQESHESS